MLGESLCLIMKLDCELLSKMGWTLKELEN